MKALKNENRELKRQLFEVKRQAEQRSNNARWSVSEPESDSDVQRDDRRDDRSGVRSESRELYSKYACDDCGKSFTQKSSLKTHMLIHSNEKPHKCTECGRRCRTKGNLMSHMQAHKVANAVPIKCTVCSRVFNTMAALEVHFRTH